MPAYYNEWDKKTAAWLRELIKAGLIAPGEVDERSIADVTPQDLKGFTQCHFFAGIGGWSYALRLAGIPDDLPLWTGSPPCQPFSNAGKQLGKSDERHLAPVFLSLIKECRPPILFGEQVSAAIGKHWLDDLFDELEKQGYASGAAVLPAASVGAPHQRNRLFFGAHQLAYADFERWKGERLQHLARGENPQVRRSGEVVSLAYADVSRCSGSESTEAQAGREPESQQARELSSRLSRRALSDFQHCSSVGGMAYPDDQRLQGQRPDHDSERREGSDIRPPRLCHRAGVISSNQDHQFWSDSDWLGCRDGKYRPIEPGSQPLANGIPARMVRLRGYGNAIVPQVAEQFIRAFIGAMGDVYELPA